MTLVIIAQATHQFRGVIKIGNINVTQAKTNSNNYKNKNRYLQADFNPSNSSMLYWHYFNLFYNLALSVHTWNNLPSGMDARFLERSLVGNGCALIAYDPEIVDVNGYGDGFFNSDVTFDGTLNIYNNPIKYRAVTCTGYNKQFSLYDNDSIIVFNNYSRTPDIYDIDMFVCRIVNIMSAIDVNIEAQKTPVFVAGNDKVRLSMANIVNKIASNIPFISIKETARLNIDNIKVLKTEAPYVVDKLQAYKKELISEYFNFLGIDNFYTTKKERNVSGEIDSNSNAIYAEGLSRLKMRQMACDRFNELFPGYNISVSLDPMINQKIQDFSDSVLNNNVKE